MEDKDLEMLWVEIESDLEDIGTVVDEINALVEDLRSSKQKPNQRDKAALGSFLHSFYNGIENILKRISREVDGTLPKGEGWHRALLKRMKSEIPNERPPILETDTVENLKPYLGFRHFFRHSYSFEIDWNKLKPLVEEVETVLNKLKRDLEQFFKKSNALR